MSNQRTPHWIITSRFVMLCAPVGIIAAILLAPFAIPLLAGFFGMLLLFWLFAQVFTNGLVRVVKPQEYKAIKQGGGDPFYDSLGVPLNFDTDAVRMSGVVPNSSCPACNAALVVVPNKSGSCPHCQLHWHNNQWWRWTGNKWVLFTHQVAQPTQQPTQQKTKPKPKQFWTGQNVGRTRP